MEKRLAEPPMICVVCREAHTISGFSSIIFERDEFRAIMHQVPAQVCPDCGESYLDETTTTDLLKRVEQIFEEGILDVVQDYTSTLSLWERAG
jgi:YgiT-type zinc finger domain-containing protein